MTCKAHFGLQLPVLLRWKFYGTLFWIAVQLPYAWLKGIYLCISTFYFSNYDLLSHGTRWELSSSRSILFTSVWVMQSLLFLFGPVREIFLLPLGLFFLKACLVLCFVDLFFLLVVFWNMDTCLCGYVYLVFPSLHIFNFKSIFVTQRKQTYASSQDVFTVM